MMASPTEGVILSSRTNVAPSTRLLLDRLYRCARSGQWRSARRRILPEGILVQLSRPAEPCQPVLGAARYRADMVLSFAPAALPVSPRSESSVLPRSFRHRQSRPSLRRRLALPLSPLVSGGTSTPRTVARTRAAATGAGLLISDDAEDVGSKRAVWEEALVENASEKLDGLGSIQCELSQFASWLVEGKLNLFPPYQRGYVWKPEKASRLVVTMLLNRLVPPIVVHQKKGWKDVVDGKQRLTSMLGFLLSGEEQPNIVLKNKTNQAKMEAVLHDLKRLVKLDESNEMFNGLSFDDLSEERQEAFRSYLVTVVIIPKKKPRRDVFGVYCDINSGGEHISSQQARRAAYYGPYIELLDTVAGTCEDFQAIRDEAAFKQRKYKCCQKDSDRELILRAFAFREDGPQFKGTLRNFLNREVESTDDFDVDSDKDALDWRSIEKLRKRHDEFVSVMKVARNVWGSNAFRKWSAEKGYWSKKISIAVWDVQYSALAELLIEFKVPQFTEAKGALARNLQDLFEKGFQNTTGRTA